eukprot:TRINITY_DN5516_c0_g1_i1.p1 TRINITY_DN5516_c0_g1~~TRINITY_DN5516_c0_g1_i1.p1  ORF type:complete len:395 (-),score=80.55 TRINITY_DN5516_c0_g1_i1:212-1396(-)
MKRKAYVSLPCLSPTTLTCVVCVLCVVRCVLHTLSSTPDQSDAQERGKAHSLPSSPLRDHTATSPLPPPVSRDVMPILKRQRQTTAQLPLNQMEQIKVFRELVAQRAASGLMLRTNDSTTTPLVFARSHRDPAIDFGSARTWLTDFYHAIQNGREALQRSIVASAELKIYLSPSLRVALGTSPTRKRKPLDRTPTVRQNDPQAYKHHFTPTKRLRRATPSPLSSSSPLPQQQQQPITQQQQRLSILHHVHQQPHSASPFPYLDLAKAPSVPTRKRTRPVRELFEANPLTATTTSTTTTATTPRSHRHIASSTTGSNTTVNTVRTVDIPNVNATVDSAGDRTVACTRPMEYSSCLATPGTGGICGVEQQPKDSALSHLSRPPKRHKTAADTQIIL